MNYREAMEAGYTVAFGAWQKRYVSRKVNMDEQPVLKAGGRHKGMLYVEAPSWESTTYSRRLYLAAPEGRNE